MKIVEAKALEKKYDMGDVTVNALRGVDFAVSSGEFVAIMGPSGSGKSTLLHILGGLDTPNAGSVSLADNNLAELQDQALTLCRRKNIGFVFQFFNLLPTLTAEENIVLPLMIDGKDLRLYREWLDTLLAMVGLLDRRYHRPDQLSGGEQQRVALARALITKPSILLADEPTGNLDSKTGQVIMELMRRSSEELGQTIVMVTHDSRASAYADRVVFLKDGMVHSEQCFAQSDSLNERLRMVIQMIELLEL